jgi:hypothetical protein
MVCAWSKLSDVVNPTAIPVLAMEPTMHRALGYHPDAVLNLRESQSTHSLVFTTGVPALEPRDTAAAVVMTRPDHPTAGRYQIIGFGSSTGPYLKPGEPVLAPTQRAVAAALKSAGIPVSDICRVHIGGLHRINSEEIASALGIGAGTIVREVPQAADLGYAAGLVAMVNALNDDAEGPKLILSAAGLGMESANAVVLVAK